MARITSVPAALGSVADIIARHKQAAGRAERWVDLYREVYEYTMPDREVFTLHSQGQRKNAHVYDSVGMYAADAFANRCQSVLTPPWRHWAILAPGSDIPEEHRERESIEADLQDATQTVFHYLNHSNFSSQVHEAYLDLTAGTCALTCDEGNEAAGDDLLIFDAVPLAYLALEAGPRGTIDNVYYCRSMPIRNIERQYPGAKLPAALADTMRSNPAAETKVLSANLFDPASGRYYGLVIDHASSELLWAWDYEESNPYIVGRATVVPGELFGRGPGVKALYDIKTANRVVEFTLKHSHLAIAPPIIAVGDSVLNPYAIRITPNTVIPVSDINNIKPLDIGGNFNVSELVLDRLHERIKKAYLDDTRKAEGPVRSASEIIIEQQDLLMQQASVFGRVQAEMLAPIIKRVVHILRKNGKIPDLRVDGKEVTIKYSSPLARAQDAEEMTATDAVFQRIMAVDPTGALLAGSVKLQDYPRWLALKQGADLDLFNTAEEVEQNARMAAEAIAAQQAPQAAPVAQ